MAYTLTISNDNNHTAALNVKSIGLQGEAGTLLDVTIPIALYQVGLSAYLDFMLPDGTTCYLGPYDFSSGAFSATLGGANQVLSIAGDITIQLIIRNVALTAVWKSQQIDAVVAPSINATAYAIPASMPSPVAPDTYPASKVTLVDAGGRITANEAETALQELAGAGRTSETLKSLADLIVLIKGAGWTSETLKGLADLIALKMNLAGGSGNPFTAMPYVGASAIVAKGSGATGEYIKFSNGIMICTEEVSIDTTTSQSNAFGTTAGTTYVGTVTWTYPVAFTAIYSVMATGSINSDNPYLAHVKSAGNTTCIVVLHTTGTGSGKTAFVMAIGTWN
jgi:hypothetical protein